MTDVEDVVVRIRWLYDLKKDTRSTEEEYLMRQLIRKLYTKHKLVLLTSPHSSVRTFLEDHKEWLNEDI